MAYSEQTKDGPSIGALNGVTITGATDNDFFVFNGTDWVNEGPSTARTSLGLGTIAVQDSDDVTITGGSITGMPSPTLGSDVATKSYADSVIYGLYLKASCTVATTANLTSVYNNGTDGVGATLTNSGAQAAIVVDTISLALNDRILVKDQSDNVQNGIYVVSVVGSGATNWVLTRATDFDTPAEIPMGSWTLISDGTAYPSGNKATQWFMDDDSFTTEIGVTPITFQNVNSSFLIAVNNLSDVSNASTARSNISAQEHDATLDALAGLSTAADKLPYFTGADTSSVTDFTSFARTLLDDADSSSARGTLGLAIGTNVQAYDSTLASFSGYNTNGLITQTAADTFAGRTITGTSGEISVSNGDGVSGNPTVGLADVGTITPGSYGSSSSVATYTVDQKGRLTAAASTAIQITESQVTDLTTDLSNKQPLDATLTALAGVTTSSNKLIYATGTDAFSTTDLSSYGRSLIDDADASAAQTTLALVPGTNVQAYDATLAALASYNTNGVICQTASDTFAGRTLTAPAAGISITNPAGIAGNPTFALADDLSAVEGLSGTGFAVRTATSTWTNRSISGTSNQISVSNGDGVSGNVVLSTPQDISTNADVTFNSVKAFRPIVSVTGTTRTLALTDANTFQECNNASAQAITVPPNSSVAFVVGTEIELWQEGAGQVSAVAGSGVTIRSKSSNLKISAQYAGAVLKKIATDTWLLVGDLTA